MIIAIFRIEKILDAKHIAKPRVRSILIKNTKTGLNGTNPLRHLLDTLLENCCINKEKKKKFGMRQLFPNKMGLADPEGRLGRQFVPEMLRFLEPCGTLVQYQVLWWRSPLLKDVLKPIMGEINGTIKHQCSGS